MSNGKVKLWFGVFAFFVWSTTALVAFRTQTYHDSAVKLVSPKLPEPSPTYQTKSTPSTTQKKTMTGEKKSKPTTKKRRGSTASRVLIQESAKTVKESGKMIELNCDIHSPLGCAQ